MTGGAEHLRLAGVHRLSLAGRGPRDAFVFDHHRQALACWALALAERAPGRRPALLVTFDRHLDLVAPRDPAAVPDASAGALALDAHARAALDPRNCDHVIAAMEAGLVGDCVAIARTALPGAVLDRWRDRRGEEHRIRRAPTLDALLAGGGLSPLGAGAPVLLDVDLDCFTTPSDADPTAVVPWPRELIRHMLLPPGSGPFWEEVLARCVALTFAREPHHAGGLVASGRLFETAAAVVFEELLGADLP